ncbi:MAG: DUF805 domain-containing protein [Opitutales bacterium]
MSGFLESDGRLGRGLFAFRFFATIIVWTALVLGVLHYVGWEWPREYQQAEFRADMGKTPEPPKPGAPAKPVPSYELAGFDRSALGAVSVFLSIVISVFGTGTMLIQVINRLRDIGWPGWYCLAMLFPVLDAVLLQGGYSQDGIWLKILVLPSVAMLGALLILPSRAGSRAVAHAH